MTKTIALLLAGAAALGPLAVGCGDDAPSKEEFAADLDAICKETRAQLERLPAPGTLKELPAYTRRSRAVVDKSIDRAEKLELPDESRKEFRDYIAASRRSVAEYERLERAAQQRDQKALRGVLAATVRDNRRRDAQAKALGLKECGNTAQG